MAYVRPKVRVTQDLPASASTVTPDLNTVIIGPNYSFLEYTNAADKQTAFAGTYEVANNSPMPYPSREAGSEVDQDSVKVYFDELLAKLAERSDGLVSEFKPDILQSSLGVHFADYVNKLGTSFPVAATLHNRGVLIGDYVKISDGSTEQTLRVIGFDHSRIDANFDDPAIPDGKVNHEGVREVLPLEPIVSKAVSGFSTAPIDFLGYYRHIGGGNVTYTVTVLETSGGASVSDSGTPVLLEVTNTANDAPLTYQIAVQASQKYYSIGSRGIFVVIDPSDSTYVVGDTATVTVVGVATGRGKFTISGSYEGSSDEVYTITVIHGGTTGNAQVFISGASGDNSGPHTVTDGVEFPIGSLGLRGSIKFPSIGKRLVTGNSWKVRAFAQGHGDAVVTGTTSQTVSLTPALGYSSQHEAQVEVKHFATKQATSDTVSGSAAVEIYYAADETGAPSASDSISVQYTTANGWRINIDSGGYEDFDNNPVDGQFVVADDGVYVRVSNPAGAVNDDTWAVASASAAGASLDTHWHKIRIYSSDHAARKFLLESIEDFIPTSNDQTIFATASGFEILFSNHTSTVGATHTIQHYGSVNAEQPTAENIHDLLADTLEVIEMEPYADEGNWIAPSVEKQTIPDLDFDGGASAANTSVKVLNNLLPSSQTLHLRFTTGDGWESSADGSSWTSLTSGTPSDDVEFSLHNGEDITHNAVLVTISSVAAWVDGSTLEIETFKHSGVNPTIGGAYRSHLDTGDTYTLQVASSGELGDVVVNVTTSTNDTVDSIVTIPGVTEYPIGSRGLTLILPSTGLQATHADKLKYEVEVTGAPMIEIEAPYLHKGNLLYTITVDEDSTIASGNLVLQVTTPQGVDDSTITVDNGATNGGSGYKVGSRGLTINILDTDPANNFSQVNGWSINTALHSKYVGSKSQAYRITVTKGGPLGEAQLTAVSNLGDSSGPMVIHPDPNPFFAGQSAPLRIGSQGLWVRFNNPVSLLYGLIAGDSYEVEATPEILQGRTKLKLNKSLPSSFHKSNLEYEILIPLNDLEIPKDRVDGLGTSYETSSTTIELSDGLTAHSSEVYNIVSGEVVPVDMAIQNGAKVYVTYNALVTSQENQVLTAEDVDDAISKLGRVEDPQNPLGYGVFKALQNTSSPIKYLRIGEDTQEGYQRALDALEDRDDVYALVPLTKDPIVHQAFRQHVLQTSTPDIGRWRIAILNAMLQDWVFLYDQKLNADTQELEDYTCTIVDNPDAPEFDPPMFTRLEDADASFLADGVVSGDVVRTAFVEGEHTEEYVVDSVINDSILILLTGPLEEVNTPQKYQIIRPLDKTQQAADIATRSSSFATRRCYYVWPDFVGDGTRQVDGYHLCAAIGGMVAGFPPHQGFTNFGIAGFDDVSRSHSYFSRTQLNALAEGGTYIVTQDAPGAIPYARHQLSTEMTTIETRELSITKNMDFISYYYKNLLKPYIGVYNVTGELLSILRTVINGGASFLQGRVFERIGAPLLDAEIVRLVQNEHFKDTVDVDLRILIPYPLNYIDLKLIV